MIGFKEEDFLNIETYTYPGVFSTLYERLDEYKNFISAQQFISAPVQRDDFNLSWFNILESKKISSQDRIISEKQRLEEDLQNLANGTLNEDLTEEANLLMDQVDNEARLKFLQLYFDAYMAPKVSDAKWRLGEVTGVVMDNASTDELGHIIDGQVYTRSNFAIPFYRRLWDGKNISSKKEYYTSLYFPPYKIGENRTYNEKTSIMSITRQTNPNASFDLDKFLIKKEGYTYRDPGFKAINDYIHFLQWIAEGTTGIVSTYLTEWDLSLYMQENLLSPAQNGGPLKLFLNYRIRNDNPLASSDGKYMDDRSLVFNVVGSAVSKIDFDCQKFWRPSDHPLSAWWTPYLKDKHWVMKNYTIEDENNPIIIPYMDIYDNIKANFPYESKNTLDIFKQQDFVGTVLGSISNFNLKYYQALYYTSGDFLTEFEIKTQSMIQKIAGADAGIAQQTGAGFNDFLQLSKKEMLLNGGYYGEPDSAGMSASSVMNRMAIEDSMNSSGDSKAKASIFTVFSKMRSDRSKGTTKALDGVDLNQVSQNSSGTGNSDVARDFMESGLSNKADASTMAKFTGINRFAPALFGGPHGADYSPNTIQGYFQQDNIFLQNVPRLSYNTSNEFNSVNNKDDYSDLNYKYKNENEGSSPNSAMKLLTKGLNNYIINYGRYESSETSWIEANIKYNSRTNQFDIIEWPQYKNNEIINYFGEIQYRQKIITRSLLESVNNWWYNYNSYHNFFNNTYLTFNNGRIEYNTVINVPYRQGTYNITTMKPYKKYLLHDMPNVKWQIIHHSFENNNNDNSQSGEFWQWVNSLGNNYKIDSSFKEKIKNKNVFILKFFENQQLEKEFITYMMGISQGKNPKIDLIFCEGNESNRFSQGPESMFKVTCSIKTYTNITEKYSYKTYYTLFGGYHNIKIKTATEYEYIPYIDVDMSNVSFYEDMLQINPKTNININGTDIPIHLKNIQDFIEKSSYTIHPIQKFKDKFYDLIQSTKSITNTIKSLPIFYWWGYNWFSNWRNFFRTRVEDIDQVNWISYGSMGLSGIGILSSIQGINPDIDNISLENFQYDFKNYLTLNNSQDIPLISLPYKTHSLSNWTSLKQIDSRNISWWTDTGIEEYNSYDMDIGLKKSLKNIFTRAKFYSDPLFSGTYISIDYPIRNFLSVLITQVSYIEFMKELIENIDFEILHNSLFTCVDACVIKANGMNKNREHVSIDKNHVLYNYWIAKAIELFGTKANFNTIKTRLKDIINDKLNKFEYAITVLNTICQKDCSLWTYNEIMSTYNLINSLKEETKKGLIEDFIFSYLNILYNYRFFFIAKRFNKENGTMWIMRALESVLDFIVPFGSDNNPPPSPSRLTNEKPSYSVVFHELQNTSEMKRNALINNQSLGADRIKTAYIKVKWVEKDAYDKWINYTEHQNTEIKVPEVIQIFHKGITKYAEKPVDGTYQLYSQEFLDNDKNIKWNNLNQQQIQKVVYDYDTCIMQINWGDSPDLTPIRWDVFGNINVNNLLEYSKASVSPEELICLIEEGADFWTVSIPESVWPRTNGYKTKLRFKLYTEEKSTTIQNDAYITLLGPMAYSIYPVTQKQERPVPGVGGEFPEILNHFNTSLN